MDHELHIRVSPGEFGDTMGIHIWTLTDDKCAVVAPVTFEQKAKGLTIPRALSMNKATAQQLMDDLWRCGIRPAEGSGSAGSLAATERHLEDMRALVFTKLEVPQPRSRST